MPAVGRHYATGFAIGGKGYVGSGYSGITSSVLNDFWEWDQNTNTWSQKANIPGTGRNEATGFSVGGYGYLGTGYMPSPVSDFYQYNPATNTWTTIAPFGGGVRVESVSFSIGNSGYLGTGWDGISFRNDFWEYHREDSVTVVTELTLSKNRFKVFPNPFKEVTSLVIDQEVELQNASLFLYDISGKEVLSKEMNQHNVTIERGNLPGGTYLLKVIDSGKLLLSTTVVIQ